MSDYDPSLLQDFLTESKELIEKLDADLVKLEEVKETPEAAGLLDGVFRALHTIKGAASFLSLTTLTTFAHAAEDALNRLRKGEVEVTTEVMDAMLRSVDVVRAMLGEVSQGSEITPGPDDLFEQLHAIAGAPGHAPGSAPGSESEGASQAKAAGTPPAGQQKTADAAKSKGNAGAIQSPLSLPSQKLDLLPFMVSDLQESARQLEQLVGEAREQAHRAETAQSLVELTTTIQKTTDFFELESLTQLVGCAMATAGAIANMPDAVLEEALVRLRGIRYLIEEQAEALNKNLVITRPTETLRQRLEQLTCGQPLDAQVASNHGNDPQKVLQIDGVLESAQPPEAAPAAAAPAAEVPGAGANTGAESKSAPKAAAAKPAKAPDPAQQQAPVAEQTVRVEVGRLEDLLNLVGQLVLNKNRLMALSRGLRDHGLPHELLEHFTGATGELDRLIGELQVGVMRTRMQPLSKLFDRYPRVIRDIARMANKKINLEILGKETEVDKTVLEQLADPLVHILRNSADHGVEPPEKRLEAGKSETGTIRLQAEHQGSHVRVAISDDGKGLDRGVLGKKAVERGMVNAEQLAALSDEDVFRFIFAAGFSTAEKITDLSGRGVGMDVVRTNINKLNGTINIHSIKGKETTIEILIPLTVAIMPAMLVVVGRHLYAIPLTSIIEIVRPENNSVYSVKGQPVLRLRDKVMPLLDLRYVLKEMDAKGQGRFAVVVGVGQERMGLIVDRLVGQQEIVIKSLDDCYATEGPFSGATIREDGGVSLILDINRLIRQAKAVERVAA